MDVVELDQGGVEQVEPGPSLKGTGRLGHVGGEPAESFELRGGELVPHPEPGEVVAVEACDFVGAEVNTDGFQRAVA